jgi:hypothetical protein
MTTEPITQSLKAITTNGTYYGWYNLVTTYKHNNGTVGHHTYEAKGQLTIKDGDATMGDATHGYDHYIFGTKLTNILEQADEDGDDVFGILDDRGWNVVDTEYILIHNGDLQLA